MLFNFNRFTDKLNECKRDIVSNEQGKSYLYLAGLNLLDVESINFDAFTSTDMISILGTIEESLTYEDDEGAVYLDPYHPYGQIYALDYTMNELEETPKNRLPSSFRFL